MIERRQYVVVVVVVAVDIERQQLDAPAEALKFRLYCN